MTKIISILLVVSCLVFSGKNHAAKGVYQTAKAFINNAFVDVTPEVKVVWLTKEDKAIMAEILQHKYDRMRIRYWQMNSETVWILDEIGKEKPITIGVYIKDKKINQFKVLTFRESRGGEVRHEFYSQQFINAKLEKNKQLSLHVDGITGATLSVRATIKVARLALWLDTKVNPVHLQ